MTSYIGKAPEFSPFPKQLFDGDNSTTDFVLNFNPGSPNALLVFELVGGEYKWREPTTDFTMLTATTLRFGTPPATGTNNIVVMFLGVRSNSLAVGPNSVSRSNLDGDLQTKTDDVANKSNKIVPGAAGNVSSLAADGDLQDAGFLASKVQQQIGGGTDGNIVSRDVNGDIQDAGFLANDVQVDIVGGVTGNLVSRDAAGKVVDAGILATDVVTEAGSQTLTNKTITTPSGDVAYGGPSSESATAASVSVAAGDIVLVTGVGAAAAISPLSVTSSGSASRHFGVSGNTLSAWNAHATLAQTISVGGHWVVTGGGTATFTVTASGAKQVGAQVIKNL